ncbi:MAG: long-chain fatty acid transport protein, partial [Desulfobacterales bacterium]|nr:long-chain fatty acid transport protein [Desulfobacterales bacterium]
MKQIKILFFSLVLVVTGSSLLWAGGADNKTNWSAEYIGILNRNAATDAADIAMYNPAGVVKMENGLYANLSGHYFPKEYNNRINGQDFETDEPSIVPGFFAVYKKD